MLKSKARFQTFLRTFLTCDARSLFIERIFPTKIKLERDSTVTSSSFHSTVMSSQFKWFVLLHRSFMDRIGVHAAGRKLQGEGRKERDENRKGGQKEKDESG